ncbi:hypothetical protein WH52_00110 [Tenacibaculum holothuriorum]|uniref:Lipoprotein n=2 Tax=Tenacibaculum holothuriorum TaxID=1635173 RepID=A0A1Y2PGH2_9FLAO|nr:hypothetical protein WH52_00110 [Tenacibaculum holothuriorum]
MILNNIKSTYLFLFFCMSLHLVSCAQKTKKEVSQTKKIVKTIKTGADQTQLYIPLLKNKNIAVVANQTSVIKNKSGNYTHIIDSLLSRNVKIKKVFSPEHGFRGKEDAGAHVNDGVDSKTQLPILSLHGKSKKPSQEQLKGLDLVVFDIQDVGARFYTYISTLHYIMEACAEANIPVIVLDRPNPNAHYIDGPVLEPKHRSFLGMHPVPVVYGMTIGEYGQMINGEKWLKDKVNCNLTVIPLENYTHNSQYSLAIKPSPNLPNDKSINLYPSLGFFEGTTINAGRGTDIQFQIYGAPFFEESEFSYTPKPNEGAKYPKHKNELCYGKDLRKTKRLDSINLEWLIDAYNQTPKTERFFGKTFTIHAGTKKLQQQIENQTSISDIRKSWENDLTEFKKVRKKYLIYQ